LVHGSFYFNMIDLFLLFAEVQSSGGIVFIVFALLMVGFVFASIAFCIWMLVDCVQNEPSEGNDKIVWLLVILLLQGLGALIYFFVRRPARMRELGH